MFRRNAKLKCQKQYMIELLNNIGIDDPKSLLRSYQRVRDRPLVSNKVKYFLKKLLWVLLHLVDLFSSKSQLTNNTAITIISAQQTRYPIIRCLMHP